MNQRVLKIENLTKIIRGKAIIQNIKFEINKGEIVGLLGPNGAGKTTVMKCLVGTTSFTKGEIVILGNNIKKSNYKFLNDIGAIIENPQFYNYLTGWQNLKQYSRMSKKKIDHKQLELIIHYVNMEEYIHKKVKTYSLGMRQRLGIAQALIHNPQLLVLDEPTNGLDPQGVKEIRTLLNRLANNGVSILISSHLLDEIEKVCSRLLIINKGIIIKDISKDQLLEKNTLISLKTNNNTKALKLLNKKYSVNLKNDKLFIKLKTENMHNLIKELFENGLEINMVSEEKISLESYFLSLFSNELNLEGENEFINQ